MAQHTPGPFTTRPANDGSGDIGICAPGVSNVIAECFADMRFDGERNFAEAEANARLIAAAPELLEALKEARDYVRQDLKNIGPCEHDVGHCVCGILSMLRRMEEAIARAEGR